MLTNCLAAQLRTFASGTRNNDSQAQMRNVVRRISGDEVAQLAELYGLINQ